MKEITVKEFIRILRNDMDDNDSKYAFFIGAGCSVTSGIPAAGECVERWLPKLKKQKGDSFKSWAKERKIPEQPKKKAAKYYKDVMEGLFNTPVKRQKEIERLIEGKDPGFGYAILAQLIGSKEFGHHFNAILTTNFDDLIADALYLFTQKKPLVITHESLISFFNIVRERPSVIKLHGDARIFPKNIGQETTSLESEVIRVLKDLFCKIGLIFIGYGGNDRSITKMLEELPKDNPMIFPWGVYWIGKSIPNSPLGKWLKKERNVTWVKHYDFDELMLLLKNEFELDHPSEKRFDELMKAYYKKFQDLGGRIEKIADKDMKEPLEEAYQKATKEIQSWWQIELEARKNSSNPEKVEQIYQEGIKKFPHSSPLLVSYANFLTDIRKEYDRAEEYYKKALDIDPHEVYVLNSYAIFLAAIRNEYDRAETYYKRALDRDSRNITTLNNYANFLFEIRNEYDRAERYYKRALDRDSRNITTLNNYANFLFEIRKEYDRAEEYYQKALDRDPRDVSILNNYAIFLKISRNEYDRAEEYYQKALDINPRAIKPLNNYANFLFEIRKEYDQAEKYYKRALDRDPNYANCLGNYAGFLLTQGRKEEGFKLLDRAFQSEIDPPELLPEILFYQYAHTEEQKLRKESLIKLKEVLLSGVNSPGWNLELNVKRALEDRHPHPEFLKKLAKVISEEISIEELEKYEIWTIIK